MAVVGAGAGTITQGQRRLAAVAAARKKLQVDPGVTNISVDIAPLSMMIEKTGKSRETGQAKYTHYETDILPTVVTDSGGGAASGATSITLTSGEASNCTIGTVLKNLRTSEEIRVTGVNTSTNVITVTRAFGGSAATINASDEFQISGFADTDGNTSPEAVSSEPTAKDNYCQILRTAVEASGRDINSDNYGDDEWGRITKDALQKHKLLKEKTYLFSGGVQTSDPFKTGGADYYITTNLFNVAGALVEATWAGTYIRNWFRRNYGSKTMVLMAGETMCGALDGFGRDVLRYAPDDSILGIKCAQYRTSFGEVKIVRHGLMTALGTNVTAANGGWGGMAYGFNMDLVSERFFTGRKLKLRTNIQQNDKDGRKDEWMEDVGFQLKNEAAHIKLYGITG